MISTSTNQPTTTIGTPKYRRRRSGGKLSPKKPAGKTSNALPALEQQLLESPLLVLDAPATNGMRPLHQAAHVNAVNVVSYLVSVGVNVSCNLIFINSDFIYKYYSNY